MVLAWLSVVVALCLIGTAVVSASAALEVDISNVTHDGFAMSWDADPEVRYMVVLYEPSMLESIPWVSLDIITESGGSLHNATDVEIVDKGAYVFSGLDSSTTYRYEVYTWPDSVANGTVTTNGPLGVFDGITVNATTSSTATISWESVVNAALYLVSLGDVPHGNTTDTKYEFTELSNGAQYVATVNTTNGTHAISRVVEFRTDSIPAALLSAPLSPNGNGSPNGSPNGGSTNGGSVSNGGGSSSSPSGGSSSNTTPTPNTGTPGQSQVSVSLSHRSYALVSILNIEWSHVEGAAYYEVQRSADGVSWEVYTTGWQGGDHVDSYGHSGTLSDIPKNMFRVVAFAADGTPGQPSNVASYKLFGTPDISDGMRSKSGYNPFVSQFTFTMIFLSFDVAGYQISDGSWYDILTNTSTGDRYPLDGTYTFTIRAVAADGISEPMSLTCPPIPAGSDNVNCS